jgi:uncharacterized protein YbjT (DUF2867 family)
MKILLTGSTGYIGRRLIPTLLAEGHFITCLVRDARRFDWDDFTELEQKQLSIIEGDLTQQKTLDHIPTDFEVAYYLVHSMSSSHDDFTTIEATSAKNFVTVVNRSQAKQIIYLSGIVNDADLSDHLLSRKNVEDILKTSSVPVTVLRAAIIIGSGSASFEIIRDLVEKLPVMIAPRWLKTKCQPIGIRNVLEYLQGVMLKPEAYNQSYDIGGQNILTYKEMLLGYAHVRGLKRLIITVPVLSPKLSSLWLYFVTSTSYTLARTLVDSMKNEVICKDSQIQKIVPTKIFRYHEALQLAFDKIHKKDIISSWKDSISLSTMQRNFLNNTVVPEHGVFIDKRLVEFEDSTEKVMDNLWQIGGERGWYYGNWLWRIRGVMDKMVGGVGLRRGRRSEVDLKPGDALDFWRVLIADKEQSRLLLYAEMKLPGEAWLEFKVKTSDGKKFLEQTATFQPLGLWGRVYWYLVLPFHGLIFPRMAKGVVAFKS